MRNRLFILITLVTSPLIGEELLPIQIPVTQYSAVWENCPFNREVVKVVEARITSNFGRNLTLDGLSHDSILGPIAYVRDLSDNQPLMITQAQSDSHPYTIVKAPETNDPREAKVTITNGQETAEIGYQSGMMTQTIAQPVTEKETEATANKPTLFPPGSERVAASANPPNGATSPQPPAETAPGTAIPNAAGRPPGIPDPNGARQKRILLPQRTEN
ncbi:MAG: hypothetical protein AAGA96_13990 [Verrucomicrobiota bacterium]